MDRKVVVAASLAALVLAGGTACGSAEAAGPFSQNADPAKLRISIHDLDLLDQHGKQGKFKSDFIGNRMTAITFTYTTCTTICPILDSVFVKLQGLLGSELGKDVTLITISIDPVTDTPTRLLEHASKLGARPGWTFLTGRKENVDRVLTGVGVNNGGNLHDHPPVILVGDPQQGVWKRLNGFPSAEKVRRIMQHIREGRKV